MTWKKPAETPPTSETSVIAYKAFNRDWTCRGFQYRVGETCEHEGEVKACRAGFHACENPLDVFNYYEPASSVFAEVSLGGDMARETDCDSKIAAARITITAEIKLHDFIGRAVKWLVARAGEAKTEHATGDRSAASATGDRSAASATGDRNAASATGDQSAASATGYQSAASATGYRSAASATGDRSAASATGYQSAASAEHETAVAMASGLEGKARAVAGAVIFLVERCPETGANLNAFDGIAGRDGVKPDTWYRLVNNKIEECD